MPALELGTGFLGRPTRGSYLTILNCGLWVIAAAGFATNIPWLGVPALVGSVPIAWILLIPSLGWPNQSEIVVLCFVIGINSVLWGYGLDWLISLFNSKNRPSPRGFEVVPMAKRQDVDSKATEDSSISPPPVS
jgi:hypothetical protein